MNRKSKSSKIFLGICIGICIGILIIGLISAYFIYYGKANHYLFYDSQKDKWNEINLEFPNKNMKGGTILVITFENSLEILGNQKKDFIKKFNNGFEIIQRTEGQSIAYSFDEVLDENANSFIQIPPNLDYTGQSFVTIHMKENFIKFQNGILGNIYLDEFPK